MRGRCSGVQSFQSESKPWCAGGGIRKAPTVPMGVRVNGHENLRFMSFIIKSFVSLMVCFQVVAVHFLLRQGSCKLGHPCVDPGRRPASVDSDISTLYPTLSTRKFNTFPLSCWWRYVIRSANYESEAHSHWGAFCEKLERSHWRERLRWRSWWNRHPAEKKQKKRKVEEPEEGLSTDPFYLFCPRSSSNGQREENSTQGGGL